MTAGHYTVHSYSFNFILCLLGEQIRDLWSSTTLHCSCAAHSADQWAGQLEELGNTDGRNVAKDKRKLRTKNVLDSKKMTQLVFA